MKFIKTAVDFIHEVWDGKSPLLLGYSGGPDSKALLYALIEAGIAPIHVAHVDHGWRAESARESEELRKEVEALGLVFHLHKLIDKPCNNIEESGRLGRLKFFRQLFYRLPFQALLLGHHAGDLAETSLKRTFEGAGLCNLGGMAKESVLDTMKVWRPFLNIPKADLIDYLKIRGLVAVNDRTNADPKFLRSRFRQEIIPYLENSFGKKISKNLVILSERSQELKKYLDVETAPLIASKKVGPWGTYINLLGVPKILQRHCLQDFLNCDQSREALENILIGLNKFIRIKISDREWIERGSVFSFFKTLPKFLSPISIQSGKFYSADWTVEIEPIDKPLPPINWEEIWTGTFEVGSLTAPYSSKVTNLC